MLLHIGLKDLFARSAIRHVELQHACLAPQGLDLELYRVGFGTTAAAMQHDVMAGLGQAQGNGAADTTAGAGDQYGFSHGVSSFDSSK